MDIITNTTYKADGKDFASIAAVRGYIENEIGKIIDQMGVRLPAKEALLLLDILIDNRERLISLLSASYEDSEQSWNDENRSIFTI